MPLNPLISGMLNPPQQITANELLNIASGVKNIQAADQAMETRKLSDYGAKEQERIKSIYNDALEVKPLIERGDIVGALTKANKRKQMLDAAGIDSSHTQQFIENIERGGIDLALEDIDNAIALGQQLGLTTASESQFGAQQTFKDDKGNLFFGTTRRSPKTGEIESVLAPIGGGPEEPIGKVRLVSGLGQTPEEQVITAGEKKKAEQEAEAGVKLKTQPEIEMAVTKARTFAKLEAEKQVAQQGQLGKLEDANAIYKDLNSTDLDIIYGKGESYYPDLLRSQRGIDLMAKRDQLIAMLQIAARGELKGQGPITEGEQGMLSNAATILANENISPEEAKNALDSAMNVLLRSAGQPEIGKTGGIKFLGFE